MGFGGWRDPSPVQEDARRASPQDLDGAASHMHLHRIADASEVLAYRATTCARFSGASSN